MPIYDYVCEDGHIVEVIHGVHESGPTKCERCGREMRKLLSTPAIVFKGSGWAKKDRSSKPAAKDKPAKDKPATDSEAKPSTTSDGQSAKSGSDSAASDSSAKP